MLNERVWAKIVGVFVAFATTMKNNGTSNHHETSKTAVLWTRALTDRIKKQHLCRHHNVSRTISIIIIIIIIIKSLIFRLMPLANSHYEQEGSLLPGTCAVANIGELLSTSIPYTWGCLEEQPPNRESTRFTASVPLPDVRRVERFSYLGLHRVPDCPELWGCPAGIRIHQVHRCLVGWVHPARLSGCRRGSLSSQPWAANPN